MPITAIAEMQQIDTLEWEERHPNWIALRNEISRIGEIFFRQIIMNHLLPLPGYWDFQLSNANKPSTMGLKVRATGNVTIYFSIGNLPKEIKKTERNLIRNREIQQFREKLLESGFTQNNEETQWTRQILTLRLDGNEDISFAIYYPGGMSEGDCAKWQVKQLLALSKLVDELYP